MNKRAARFRRAIKARVHMRKLGVVRLVVHKSIRHMYAQIISKDNRYVLVSASTTEKVISSKLTATGNKQAASMVGKIIAERSIAQGIIDVSFDRSGFKYHGRVKAVAEHAKQYGLKF